MKKCSRCGRPHSGICGIPAGVTLGFGAKVGGAGCALSQFPLRTKPSPVKKGVGVLKGLLEEARIQEKKVVYMLNAISPEMPEYNDLLDRLGKVSALIIQLNRQIIERESG